MTETQVKPDGQRLEETSLASLLNINPETQLVTVDDQSPTVSVIWDRAVQQAVIETSPGPTIASRSYAMVHTAMYDAWSAYEDTPISTNLGDMLQRPEAENTVENKSEAMSYAAYPVLVALFPEQQEIFARVMSDMGYDPNAIAIPTDAATPAAIGAISAQALLAYRAFDGANQLGNEPGSDGTPYSDYTGYQPVNEGGNVRDIERWTPDLLVDSNAIDESFISQEFLTPQWGQVNPFALDYGSQFRPSAPQPFLLVDGQVDLEAKTITLEDGTVLDITPELVGTVINPEFIAQAEEVVEFSANLNDREKLIAEFWEDGGGTSFPPGTWMTFGQYVSARDDNTLDEDAQMFFSLGNAVFDAGIATWESKVFYDYTRPIAAVQTLGDLGLIGEFDPDLGGYAIEAYVRGEGKQTILATDFITYQTPNADFSPPFAEYTSGHSAFSAAGARVLQQYTGSDDFGGAITINPGESRFEAGATPDETVTLQWDSFTEAADEAGLSRLFGGIHFEEGDLNGRELGREVGDAVLEQSQFYINGGDIHSDVEECIQYGATDPNVLIGRETDDAIDGLEGSDVLYGLGGNDLLHGNAGTDIIQGNDGDDSLYGDRGDDFLDGNIGSDDLLSGEGNDRIMVRVGQGGDSLFDYHDGVDKLVLADGLTYEDLRFDDGGIGTQIAVDDTSENLLLLVGISADVLDESDFIAEF